MMVISIYFKLAMTERVNGCSYLKHCVTVHAAISVTVLEVSSDLRISINTYALVCLVAAWQNGRLVYTFTTSIVVSTICCSLRLL